MSRTGKIALVAALCGLFMALAIGMALREAPNPSSLALPGDGAGDGTLPRVRELRRCRTLTLPDNACEAVWEEWRRRFHRKDERP